MLPIFFQETSTELSEMETSLRNKADMVEKFSKLLLNSLSENHFTKFNDEDVFKQNLDVF